MKLFYLITSGLIIALFIFSHVAHSLLLTLILVLIGGGLYDFLVLSRRRTKPHELPSSSRSQTHNSYFHRKERD